jgi:hypothetical protein
VFFTIFARPVTLGSLFSVQTDFVANVVQTRVPRQHRIRVAPD